MADYILDVLKETSKLDWAMPFQRTGAFPLDRSTLFSSLADAKLYAAGNGEDARGLGGASYVGQSISVHENDAVTLYTIQPDRSLKEVGSAPVGDNLSVEVVEGKVQLRNFGKGYYKYVPKTSTEAAKYEFVKDDFISGLEPRVVRTENGLEIAWYQPSNEEFYTKTEVETLIKTAINDADHLKRKKVANKEDIDLEAKDADQYIYMVPTGFQHEDDKYDEYIVIDNQLEKVGDWEVDLTGYYTKEETDTKIADAVKAATGGESAASVATALNAYKTSNDNRVKAVEEALEALKDAEKNVVNSVSSDFTISEARVLSLNDIPIAKITNLQTTIEDFTTRIETLEDVSDKLDITYVKVADYNVKIAEIEQAQQSAITDIGELQDLLTWKDITNE